MRRRNAILLGLTGLVLIPLGRFGYGWISYPSDRSPEGAYYRIVASVNRRHPKGIFPYTETAAQHACFTIRDYRRQSQERILASYPEAERAVLLAVHVEEADAPDGADIFAIFARRRGWLDALRRDMSAIAQTTVGGDRATLQTVRGTRYSFRRRENGIWGLTQFTAALVAEAEKAARDAAMIERAAADYERVRGSVGAPGASAVP
ncbi:MAG: hypothetical protein JW751_22690 [Polyangiaceae bacterium]|nr:hypothetical protein [Polyangiaceae bacterium]